MEQVFINKYKDKWQQERAQSIQEGKLGILAKCKNKFAPSPYLESDIFASYKMALTKFRISAHRFPIEVDRYSKIPREARVCVFGCNAIGGMREVYIPLLNNSPLSVLSLQFK